MALEILMPALSPTMTEGNLTKWLKKEGDVIAPGDVLAEIETDKATMEVEAVDAGILAAIVVPGGSKNVPVNRLIAVLKEKGDSDESVQACIEAAAASSANTAPVEASAASPVAATTPAPSLAPTMGSAPSFALPAAANAPAPARASHERVKASPLAKRVAEQSAVPLAMIRGTGPKGRIIKADVEEALRNGVSAGERVIRNPQLTRAVENSSMRQTIAKRLLESKQWVPHFYLSVECEMDALMAARHDANEATDKKSPSYKLSVNDFVIKAVAMALRKVPEANASWAGDVTHYYTNVDVAVAVALEGGLVTPIVANADQKSIMTISNEMKGLAKRAKEGKLKPEEYQGGGFSISNLGMFGVQSFSAIINPPQACILAVGASEKKAVVKHGQLAIATCMQVTLSCDHRAVDGAVGATFLRHFKHYIEHPVLLFMPQA